MPWGAPRVGGSSREGCGKGCDEIGGFFKDGER